MAWSPEAGSGPGLRGLGISCLLGQPLALPHGTRPPNPSGSRRLVLQLHSGQDSLFLHFALCLPQSQPQLHQGRSRIPPPALARVPSQDRVPAWLRPGLILPTGLSPHQPEHSSQSHGVLGLRKGATPCETHTKPWCRGTRSAPWHSGILPFAEPLGVGLLLQEPWQPRASSVPGTVDIRQSGATPRKGALGVLERPGHRLLGLRGHN